MRFDWDDKKNQLNFHKDHFCEESYRSRKEGIL